MILKFKNQRVINDTTPFSQISDFVEASDTTITVLSDERFSGSDKYILIGEFGDENSEIVTFTSATGNVLTVGAVTKDHPAGTPVRLINANQVDFFYSATVDGTYTAASKVDINAESLLTTYEDSSNSSGFGKAKLYNEAEADYYQTFWEIIKYSQDDRKTRGFVKRLAKAQQNITDNDPDITEDFLNDMVALCDETIREERINWKEETGELVIETAVGQTKYDISSYFKEQLTISSVLYAKADGEELSKATYDIFLNELGDAVWTTLADDVATTDVTITVTDSSDLPDEGSITIGTDTIAYTDNDRDTNILSGVTGIDSTHSTGDEVWYNITNGTPNLVSVNNGYLYIQPLINASKDAKTIRLIYSKQYTNITLDSDELAFPSFLYINFLRAAISSRKGDKDAQALQRDFDISLIKHKNKDISSVETSFKPNMVYPSSRRGSLR